MKQTKYFSLQGATEQRKADRADIAQVPYLELSENFYSSQSDNMLTVRGDIVDHVTDVTSEEFICLGPTEENYDHIAGYIPQGMIEDDIQLSRIFPRVTNSILSGTYSTGTAQYQAGSNVINGTGTTWTGNVSGGNILKISSIDTYFRIKSVNAATQITLEDEAAAIIDTTGSATYVIYKTHDAERAKNIPHFELFNNTQIYNFPLIRDMTDDDVWRVSGPFYRTQDALEPSLVAVSTPYGTDYRVATISVDDGGSGYTDAPDVAVDGNALAESHLVGSAVASIDDNYTFGNAPNGGFVVVHNPSDALTVSGDGSGADITVNYAGGFVGAITGVRGSGYSIAPTLDFSAGDGSGAAATCTVSGGKIDSVTITNPGSGYSTSFEVTAVGGDGSGATFNAVVYGGSVAYPNNLFQMVDSLTINDGGSGYTYSPSAQFEASAQEWYGTVFVPGDLNGYQAGFQQASFSDDSLYARLDPVAVDTISVIDGGSGYPASPLPDVTISSVNGDGSSATASATLEEYTLYHYINTIIPPSVNTNNKFVPLSTAYRSNAFGIIDLYVVLLGTLESGTYYPRRLRYSVPDTYNDFSNAGSGSIDVPGSGYFLDARTIDGGMVIAESGGISFINTTGDPDNPFEYRMLAEGTRTVSNLCRVGKNVYFINNLGSLAVTNGVTVDEVDTSFNLTKYNDLNAETPVQIVYNQTLSSLLVFTPDSSLESNWVYVIGMKNWCVSRYKFDTLSDGDWPKSLIAQLSSYADHGED